MQNRVIKFRAWIPKKEFIENVIQDAYMAIQGTADLETLQSFMHHYGNEPLLMQFTGLTDKNGVDAYIKDKVVDVHGQEFVIEWDYPLLARLSEIEFEIIGNVYENE